MATSNSKINVTVTLKVTVTLLSTQFRQNLPAIFQRTGIGQRVFILHRATIDTIHLGSSCDSEQRLAESILNENEASDVGLYFSTT